jgi:hypothetical protein
VRTELPRPDNVVARLKSPPRARFRLPRIPTRVALLLALVLVAGTLFAPNRETRGVSLLLLFVGSIGWLISWQSQASRRLSESGRNMDDYQQSDENVLPPP